MKKEEVYDPNKVYAYRIKRKINATFQYALLFADGRATVVKFRFRDFLNALIKHCNGKEVIYAFPPIAPDGKEWGVLNKTPGYEFIGFSEKEAQGIEKHRKTKKLFL